MINCMPRLLQWLAGDVKEHTLCAILGNALTCLYGNIVLEKFEVQPPSLQDYFQ